MNWQTLAAVGCVLYAVYTYWPKIKRLMPSLPQVISTGGDESPSDGSDFDAYQQLQRRAARLHSAEAQRCLQNVLVPLFGGKVDEAEDPEENHAAK